MKILYVRSGPYQLTFDNYNLQEVGLGKAFCRAGYDFDIVYYSKENKNQDIETNQGKLRILWRKGIKVLRTGIYPGILKKDFLKQYDAVITSEYSQFMSLAIALRHNNVYMYNGPYYNLFKIPFVEKIYDKLFCKTINCKIKKIFCKTKMSMEYIALKGITNTMVTGVGLDDVKFLEERDILDSTERLLEKLKNHRNILFIGSIIKRKNVELIIKAFIELRNQSGYEDVQLVLVGKGEKSYTNYCCSLIPENLTRDVIWVDFVKNAQMKFVYQAVDIFLLPSIQEIFGMVLLESMYFGKPVISSHSAGADTLIENGKNGIIIESFDIHEWKNHIANILDNNQYASQLGKNAAETIKNEFMWDKIAKKMIECIENS